MRKYLASSFVNSSSTLLSKDSTLSELQPPDFHDEEEDSVFYEWIQLVVRTVLDRIKPFSYPRAF